LFVPPVSTRLCAETPPVTRDRQHRLVADETRPEGYRPLVMSRGGRGVVRVEVERRFEVSVREGFDDITDTANWADYWLRFVHLDPGVRWREPGDRARLTLRMLAREVELDMTHSRIEPCRVVEYTSEQRGLPVARRRRQFDEAGGGLAYGVVIEYSPRAWWRGMLDRTAVRQATTRTARTTMAKLERRFREQRREADGAAGVPPPRARRLVLDSHCRAPSGSIGE
jgi:hypothetical protein